ncbi:PASTA domain-containing protein, partial [Schumannella luteola]
LPDIAGLSIEDATAKLTAAGLQVDPSEQRNYNDDVPKDAVIGIVDRGAVHPDDTVILDVSDGPQPIPVPDIVGRTWYEAKKMLTEAGLGFEYWNLKSQLLGDGAPSDAVVEAIDPDAGAELHKGDKVRVRLS